MTRSRQRNFEASRSLDRRLRNMEIMVKDLHMSNSQDRRNSDTSNDASGGSSTPFPSRDEYQSMLHTVSQQRILAMLEREDAKDDAQVQEWKELYDQLDQCQRRVLNAIERNMNGAAQRGGNHLSSIQWNQELAARNAMGTPLKSLNRSDTYDSGIGESLPSVAEESDSSDEQDPLSDSPTAHAVPLTYSTHFSNSSSPRQIDLQCRGYSPPPSVESVSMVSGPDPYYRPRTTSVASSETSGSATHSYWQNVQHRGWVKMFVSPY
jgi:hypothetical protein